MSTTTGISEFIRDLDVNTTPVPNTITVRPDDVSEFQCETESVSNPSKQISICMLTLFVDNFDPKYLTPSFYFDNETKVKNWVGQFEICPTTGKKHAHIYMQFDHKNRMRFTKLREVFCNKLPGCRITVPRSRSKVSKQNGVNYCLKPEGRAPNTAPYIHPGNKDKWEFDAKQYSKRDTDNKQDKTEQQRILIESFDWWLSWEDIVHSDELSKKLLCNCSWGKKYHEGRKRLENPRRVITDVKFWFGAGGTGKTTQARQLVKDDNMPHEYAYYKRNPAEDFWGGGATAYQGQRVVHFDEFCGNEPFYKFKEYCDVGNQGPPVKVKNGGAILNHDTVVVTSNHHPAAWYYQLIQNDPRCNWVPFWRRVTDVRFYPELREDGSPNSPSNDNPPYYVDCTDEWKCFQSWEDCKDHADSLWPLSDKVTNSGYEATDGTGFQGNFSTSYETGTVRKRGRF